MAHKKKLPSFKDDFAQWYQRVIYDAELVDQSPIRGAMVIRPYGYAIWEHIKAYLDERIKKTGHQNTAFPLLIPESFLKKEATHVEGFAPELAVVTHAGGKQLEEPLVVRPTSETIVHYMFAKWIKSWRDLPIKINQWANVVRWEMRPRAFLRTTEFFWQEGHTAHQTYEQAAHEANLMLQEYVRMCDELLALPSIVGEKTDAEKFPGAVKTLTFEGIMPDGKALQMGTSHLLSQSFAQAFQMQFQDEQGALSYPYLTSWGTTTRLVGATIMMHGDDAGLVLPPPVAPYQVVIIPILKKNADNNATQDAVDALSAVLSEVGVRVHVDNDPHTSPGAKFFSWELKGVPLRIELGPRDVATGNCVLKRRVDGEKLTVSLDQVATVVQQQLGQIYTIMKERAVQRRDSCMVEHETIQDISKTLSKHPHGIITGWCESPACEQVLDAQKATIRCIVAAHTHPHCFNCGEPALSDILVAQAY